MLSWWKIALGEIEQELYLDGAFLIYILISDFKVEYPFCASIDLHDC